MGIGLVQAKSELSTKLGEAILALLSASGASDQVWVEADDPGVLRVFDTARPEHIVVVERRERGNVA